MEHLSFVYLKFLGKNVNAVASSQCSASRDKGVNLNTQSVYIVIIADKSWWVTPTMEPAVCVTLN